MDLEQTLQTVVGHLRSGNLDNEAQVKLVLILPVLRALNWNDADPKSVKPEYDVPGGAVDYALIYHDKPLVFIEAKKLGNLNDSGIEQVFGYANNRGVPFLILTDGNRWEFYLSMADGDPKDRQFYDMELRSEDKMHDYANFLRSHLERDAVVSREARLSAEDLLAERRNSARAREVIPDAWQSLLQEPDETLRDLLAEAVQSKCGTKPALRDVEQFLLGRLYPVSESEAASVPRIAAQTPLSQTASPTTSKPRIVGFTLELERVEVGTAIGTLALLLTRFSQEDATFMERFSRATVSKSRSLVARNRAELYEKQHLAESFTRRLENGWWLGTNLSQAQVRGHIEAACAVAGVQFNGQLKLIER